MTSDPEKGEFYLNGDFHTPGDLLPRKAAISAGMPPLPDAVRLPDELAADACPWLDAYVRFSRLWSPRAYDDFHESVGLWLLSTVAARRVSIDLGKRRYTNLYIALTARTSVYAKSTTADIARSVLAEAGLSHLLAPDDATPQAFVRGLTYELPAEWERMSEMQRQQTIQKLTFAGQQGWFFDEFGQKVSAMMRDGGHMADFRGLLRKFDDTPDVYEYVTIGRGRDVVHRPYLALLANLTPADLQPYAKRGAALWGDGFWARFAFLTPPEGYERKKGRFPTYARKVPEELSDPLRFWHRRLGIPTPDVVERTGEGGKSRYYELVPNYMQTQSCTLGSGVFEAWYAYNDALGDIIDASKQIDLDGNYTRFAEKALRVAMLIASLGNAGRIEMKHWARAQQVSETWRRNLHHLYQIVTSEQQQSKYERIEENILKLIAERGPLTKRELYQNVHGLDSSQAGIVLKAMTETGLLELLRDGRVERFKLVG